MSLPHELIAQRRDHSFGSAVELRRDALAQRCDLRNAERMTIRPSLESALDECRAFREIDPSGRSHAMKRRGTGGHSYIPFGIPDRAAFRKKLNCRTGVLQIFGCK